MTLRLGICKRGLALSQLCQAKTHLIRSEKYPNRLPIKIHECKECGFRTIETPSYEDQQRAKRASPIQKADIDTQQTQALNDKLQDMWRPTKGNDK